MYVLYRRHFLQRMVFAHEIGNREDQVIKYLWDWCDYVCWECFCHSY